MGATDPKLHHRIHVFSKRLGKKKKKKDFLTTSLFSDTSIILSDSLNCQSDSEDIFQSIIDVSLIEVYETPFLCLSALLAHTVGLTVRGEAADVAP